MANKAAISNISVDLSELSADTSPQLGGNLDLNSNNITGTGNINTTGTITSSGNITGNTFSGSGASLTNLPSAQLTGALPAISGANLTGINTDLVADTTPQLGGNLDLNSNNITGTGDVNITGDIKADDIVLKNGNASNLTFETTNNTHGYYRIKSNVADGTGNYGLIVEDGATNNDLAKFWSGSAATSGSFLYHNGTERLHAHNSGVDITGNLNVSGTITPSAYRAGEVIECLSGLCDGRTVTGLSGSYTWPNGTQHVPSTTYVNLNGSVISYTPPTGTNVVKYELVYHTSYYGTSAPLFHTRFYYDSTEVTVGRYSQYQYYDGANQPYTMVLSLNNGTPNIAGGQIGTWNSAKEMKLMIRSYTASYRPDVNSTHYFDGAGARYHVYPKLTITAIA